MFHTLQNSQSIWQEVEPPVFPPLGQDLKTEICVVGAGISGVTTAYLLLKNGFQVTLLDRDSFGDGETARTTAHLSNVLDAGFTKVIRLHGEKGAKLAFESHSDAIDLIEKIIEEESIDCDFKRVEGYLFLSPDSKANYLQEEYEACKKVGFQEITLEASPRYFATLGPAIRYPQQGRFHSLKYLKGLLKAIVEMGGKVYGLTKVTEVHGGKDAYVKTDFGHRVSCEQIVVTTNVPMNDWVQIHIKEGAYRSYVIGIEVPENTFPDILLWDTGHPYHYVRKIESKKKGFDIVLVGGEDHRVGQEKDDHYPFEKIEKWARERLGLAGKITHKWSGQIIEPFDGLAFIGRNPMDADNVFIITGGSGHGLTHGSLGATIVRDLIQDHPNEWSKLYDPSRISPRALGLMAKENAKSILPYEDHLYLKDQYTKGPLVPGTGVLVRDKLKEVAVYCDPQGKLHSFSATCPHLGGVVHWNEIEKTWDCPCHGSRFSCTGQVLNGPAISNLEEVPVPRIEQIPRDTSQRGIE
jgi:glycine/D-amino acid oxidase-like deaminating enzyme/nitrite reductase/ring-hydroxylating ferredoxin subunit